MFAKRMKRLCRYVIFFTISLIVLSPLGHTGEQKKDAGKSKGSKTKVVWTNPSDPTLPMDFKIQGEYVGMIQGGQALGCQVISLGGGAFQAVFLPGGLPGEGWDGKNKILLAGQLDGDAAVFSPATGKRRYLAHSPMEFSATSKFPPVGHKEYSAAIAAEKMSGKSEDGTAFVLKKIERKSQTLGDTHHREEALVLFDGSNTNEWKGGRLDKQTGWLNTDGNDITTKRKFSNYIAHLEFMLPFRPDARGQGRGNSGFYQVDHYEIQILDSFGLEGKSDECGGIYSRVSPRVNMCLPPLTWQTYDVEFTNATLDKNGKKTKNSHVTLKLNGVVIHDDVDIPGVTGGARSEPEGTPGVLRLQGHGNPLQFRNIWIVEKK